MNVSALLCVQGSIHTMYLCIGTWLIVYNGISSEYR